MKDAPGNSTGLLIRVAVVAEFGHAHLQRGEVTGTQASLFLSPSSSCGIFNPVEETILGVASVIGLTLADLLPVDLVGISNAERPHVSVRSAIGPV